MILSGMRPSSGGPRRPKFVFNLTEKAETYLELFRVFTAVGQKEEAGQVIQEAMTELRNSPQEGLILLAQVYSLLEFTVMLHVRLACSSRSITCWMRMTLMARYQN